MKSVSLIFGIKFDAIKMKTNKTFKYINKYGKNNRN